METGGAAVKRSQPVLRVWEAGREVRALWGNSFPQSPAVLYLVKVLVVGLRGGPAPDPFGPPPEV